MTDNVTLACWTFLGARRVWLMRKRWETAVWRSCDDDLRIQKRQDFFRCLKLPFSVLCLYDHDFLLTSSACRVLSCFGLRLIRSAESTDLPEFIASSSCEIAKVTRSVLLIQSLKRSSSAPIFWPDFLFVVFSSGSVNKSAALTR